MSREAMKMALEALEYPLKTSAEVFDADKAELMSLRAVDAIRAALAEPEQDDPALTYCHRFAILMECVMLGGVDEHWNEIAMLLNEYHMAQHAWRESHGEPYVSGFGKD